MPAQEIGDFCKEHGASFILDTAQTAGTINIDMERMSHRRTGIYRSQGDSEGHRGTGGFLIHNKLAAQIEPLISGLEQEAPLILKKYRHFFLIVSSPELPIYLGFWDFMPHSVIWRNSPWKKSANMN